VVDVVNEEVVGGIGNLAVHPDYAGFEERAARDGAEGVKCAIGAIEPPFESAEAVIVGRVNDGKPEFFDVDEAGGMAEAEAVIEKNEPEAQPREAIRNVDLNSCHFISSFFLATDCTDYTDLF